MLMLAWNAALSFSPLPLRMSPWLGFVFTGIGISYGAYALGRFVLGQYVVPGWTSSIVLNCLIGGVYVLNVTPVEHTGSTKSSELDLIAMALQNHQLHPHSTSQRMAKIEPKKE